MTTYGVTPTGFKRKRLSVILKEKQDELKSIFGENLDLSDESPDGEVVGIYAESESDIWEIAEACYNAFDPDSAVRRQLDVLLKLTGIERLEAAGATNFQEFAGVAGTVIPEGALIKIDPATGSSLQFKTLADITIPAGGTIVAQIQCTTTGPIVGAIGTINQIETPVSGWVSTSNTSEPTGGTFEETDPEARSRRNSSVAIKATNILDAIFANISNIDGVEQAVVVENKTDATDANGLLPHSIEAIVLGGTDAEVATAIFQKLNGGCNMNGDVTIPIQDSQGFPQNFTFRRPPEIPVYVEVDVTVVDPGSYPSNGADLIKQAIIDYAAGDLINTRGFSIGDDVIRTRLFTAANSVGTSYNVGDIRLGDSPGTIGYNNVTIDFREISSWDAADILVTEFVP